MVKFEYKYYKTSPLNNKKELVEKFNEFGLEGWKMVNFVIDTEGELVFYFIREI